MKKPEQQLTMVALVGRVNVGKSTLFNRIVEKPSALVSSEPGTTRDRREAEVMWQKREFVLVDTGGVEQPKFKKENSKRINNADDLNRAVAAQTEQALERAALALLIVDANTGLLPTDREWARALRGRWPTLLVVNKVDSTRRENALPEFYRLGLGTPIPVSASSGRGVGDLLDRIVGALPQERHATKELTAHPLKIAILGQPNVGKSTLVNAILDEERMITNPRPHTTREPQNIYYEFDGRVFIIIDTAGIRRRAHVTPGIERAGVNASLKTVDRADVVLLLLDVTQGPTSQDQRLARYVVDHGKGLVLVINKWDLIEDKAATTLRTIEAKFRRSLPGLNWVPMIFVSALTKQRVNNVLEMALGAQAAGGVTLSDEALGDFLRIVTRYHRPVKASGVRHPKLLSMRQIRIHPPQFEVVTAGEVHHAYARFLENRLREHFGLGGTPVTITLKTKRPRTMREKK